MGAQLCSLSRGEAVRAPRDNPAAEGEMSSKEEDSPEPGTSAASTSGAARDGGGQEEEEEEEKEEAAACPACRDIDTECSSSCRHCFCPLCLWDWSLGCVACPRCRRPTRHPYPQHVALYHEVQERVYDGKRRRRRLQERRSRSRSGHGRDGTPRLGRSGSRGWHRRWARGSGSSSRRRRRRRRRRRCRRGRNWDEGRAPRPERGGPGSSWGRRPWRGARVPRSRERRRDRNRERSHRWDREWSRSRRRGRDTPTPSRGREPHHGFARQRRWRSRNADGGPAPRHQPDIPESLGRSRYPCRTWSPGGHRNQ